MKSIDAYYDFAPHAERIRDHYAHAREKHPYFCDWVAPDGRAEGSPALISKTLKVIRQTIKRHVKYGILGWDDLLDCEVWEAFDALVRGDKAQAVEELYDCIAVCLRAIDVIEGRQKLGKPTENNKENDK